MSASRIDLDKLKGDASNNDLYQIAARASGQTSGVVDVDISHLKLADATKFRFAQWAVLNQPVSPDEAEFKRRLNVVKNEQPARVEKPVEPQISMEDIQKEEMAAIQKAADEAAAKNRLRQYANEQGLEETDSNFALIKNFVDTNTKTKYWSEQIVNLAIQNLRNRLSWKPKVVLAPTPPLAEPQEPAEVLEPWQLPIDANERAMKAASVVALQDLIKRRRAVTNQQIIRSRAGEQRRGSSF